MILQCSHVAYRTPSRLLQFSNSAPQAFLGVITRAHEGGLNVDGGQVGGKRIAIHCLKLFITLPEVRRLLTALEKANVAA